MGLLARFVTDKTQTAARDAKVATASAANAADAPARDARAAVRDTYENAARDAEATADWRPSGPDMEVAWIDVAGHDRCFARYIDPVYLKKRIVTAPDRFCIAAR